MKNMVIQQCVLGMVCTNCYFLMNKDTKELLIVDPADHSEKIESMVARMEGTPVAILLTHGHYDHIMAAKEIKHKYGIPVYAHKDEQEILENPGLNLSISRQGGYAVKADELVTDNQELELAGFRIKVLHTPGHTKGSCCYYFEDEDILISGDTLFCQSVGRTDLPSGSTSQIIDSLHRLLDHLPDQVDVLPGHESTTTIAHEKRYNPFV